MMNLRFLALALLLFLSVSVVFAEDAVEKEIDCAKDCANFVSAVAQKEKAAVEDKLSQCQKVRVCYTGEQERRFANF
jgi:hypothetical protein